MNIFNFNINPVHTNVNWNTLITVISTLLSVLFGYFLKSIKESKSNKREVLEYAYDLNILLKRLMLIYSDIDKKLIIQDKDILLVFGNLKKIRKLFGTRNKK